MLVCRESARQGSRGNAHLIYYRYVPQSLREYRRGRQQIRTWLLLGLALAVVLPSSVVWYARARAAPRYVGGGVALAAPASTPATVAAPPTTERSPEPSPSPPPTSVPIALKPADEAALMTALRPSTPTPIPRPPLPGRDDITARLKAIVAGQKGTYAICVVDLASQQWYGFAALDRLDAASVNKLAILAAVYYQAGLGRLDLNQIVTTTPDDIQDYGTGSIRYDRVGSSYSLRTLSKLMIEQSDNTASYLLANVVGIDTIQGLLTSWGLLTTTVGDDTTSARDTSILLEMIYRKQITTPTLTAEMVDFLTNTDFKDRIPALLPPDVLVGHKIGNHVGVLNDAGIVYLVGRPYVIVMLGQNVDETQGLGLEQTMSKAVYDFQSSLPAVGPS